MTLQDDEYGSLAALAGSLRGYVAGVKDCESVSHPDDDAGFCAYVGDNLTALSARMRKRVDQTKEDEGETFESIAALSSFVIGLHDMLATLDDHPLSAPLAHVLSVVGERFAMLSDQISEGSGHSHIIDERGGEPPDEHVT